MTDALPEVAFSVAVLGISLFVTALHLADPARFSTVDVAALVTMWVSAVILVKRALSAAVSDAGGGSA